MAILLMLDLFAEWGECPPFPPPSEADDALPHAFVSGGSTAKPSCYDKECIIPAFPDAAVQALLIERHVGDPRPQFVHVAIEGFGRDGIGEIRGRPVWR